MCIFVVGKHIYGDRRWQYILLSNVGTLSTTNLQVLQEQASKRIDNDDGLWG